MSSGTPGRLGVLPRWLLFPYKTIQRYRKLGLRTVCIGRRVEFRLDDVLRFMDGQQERLRQKPSIQTPATKLSDTAHTSKR